MDPLADAPARRGRLALAVAAALILAVAGVAAAVVLGDDGGAEEPSEAFRFDSPAGLEGSPLDAGEPAPDGTFTYFDGTVASLADFGDRPLVVNFFAHWCAPCVEEMPEFQEVSQEYLESVIFLGLAVNDTVEDAQAIVERTGVTYEVGRDTSGIIEAFGAVTMPSTAFVRADGTVARVHSGVMSADQLRTAIEEGLLR